MKNRLHHSFTALALLVLSTLSLHLSAARAQGTPFLYRGHLIMGGSPANGTYDLAFSLCETIQGGAATAGPITNSATKVTDGLFFVTLDFGPGPFTGTNYWLDINVRPAASNTFTKLSVRQRLTPSPYAHGPQRLVSSVMRPRQPAQALELPLQNTGPGSTLAQPSPSRPSAPIPKPEL
jgi:hypothetical protein